MQAFNRKVQLYRCCVAGPVAVLIAPPLAGCAEEAAVEDTCAWVFSPSECKDHNRNPEANDEVGDGDGDGDVDPDNPIPGHETLNPDVCLSEPNGHTKTVHQCQGSLSVSIAFETLLGGCAKTLGEAALCTEVHDFGPGHDRYETPAVMACCNPLDRDGVDAAAIEEAYLQYCAADAVEQICRSLPLRLQKYIDDGRLPVGKNQAQKLQAWLAQEEHLQSCYDALYTTSDESGQLDAATWLINNGDNGDWKMLDNFRVTLEYGEVEAVSLPDDPDEWKSCGDSNFNNAEVFESRLPRPAGIVGDITSLVSPAAARLVGPELFGGRITGSASLTSSFDTPLEIFRDTGTNTWMLAELELFSETTISVANAGFEINIEHGAIRLYGSSMGTITRTDDGRETHVIPAHSASFVISGVISDVQDLRWASNATPIVAHQTATGWALEGFEIEHYDSYGDRWALSITPTTWK